MSLRAWIPRWWRGEAGIPGVLASAATAPLELAYRAAAGARARAYDAGLLRPARATIPVVSVGNVVVGGAGKTPVAAWIAGRLRDLGRRPAVALRGYGADEVRVHGELNPEVPVFAAPRRRDAVAAAAAAGCDCAVLDDGFQHRRLARDLDIVLVPVEGWCAHPRLLPRGPWREPPAALARAGLVLVTRKSAGEAERDGVLAGLDGLLAGDVPVAACHLAPVGLTPLRGGPEQPLTALRGRPVLAVAALAAPDPFLEQLRAQGAEVEPAIFPDHHDFGAADAERIAAAARGRRVVMTLKDAVKLCGVLDPGVEALVLRQAVRVEQGAETIDAALRRALEGG